MITRHMRRRVRLLSSVCLSATLALPDIAWAAEDGGIEEVVVTTSKSILPATIPAVVETVTAEQIHDTVNAATSAETIKYLPSIQVRERYIGDRNGIVSTRTTGTVSSAQTMVYGDQLLLSNFLGNSYSYPPRWGMVSPEEITRVNVMYGPFSALYPGNSLGGVVTLETRMPEATEVHGSLQGFRENFNLYGTHDTYDGLHATAAVGGRPADRLSFWLGADHLDSKGHPMTFAVATSTATGAATAVTGAYQDKSEKFQDRYVFGATGIDHTIQDMTKLKIAYDITPTVRATWQTGLWQANSDTSVQSYLTNSTTGQPLYNGTVLINGSKYTVSMNPGTAEMLHVMNGVSLKSESGGRWDGEASASLYTFAHDVSRTASNYGNTNSGTATYQDGTGWGTADLRGIWRPSGDTKGPHEVSVGYHFDQYQLDQTQYNTSDWKYGAPATFSSASAGNTRTQAGYLQDAWTIVDDWVLTLGGREEYWTAYGGKNRNTTSLANYAEQETWKLSPKASLAYQMNPDLSHRVSVGKAYRFPTVNELFQQLTTGSTIITGNPDLKPEQVWSYEWTSEYTIGKNSARISLFQEDRTDALVSQTDTTLNRTLYENIDSVRIRGVETAFKTKDLLVDKLDFAGSLTLASSRILRDQQNPSLVGNEFQRIPAWRATALATYHQTEDWASTLGLRYASAAYGQIDNSDTNHGVYGGISQYVVTDIRTTYKVGDNFSLAAGIDNLFDQKYYVSPHPYPQRTFFGEAKCQF
jgi:iron complex outermembrane recepter protein